MTVQVVVVNPTIEWDDGLVFVFSFSGANNTTIFCGIIHVVLAVQLTTGQQAQVTPLLQAISQNSFQGSSDPQVGSKPSRPLLEIPVRNSWFITMTRCQ
jgi:hypothetical protein